MGRSGVVNGGSDGSESRGGSLKTEGGEGAGAVVGTRGPAICSSSICPTPSSVVLRQYYSTRLPRLNKACCVLLSYCRAHRTTATRPVDPAQSPLMTAARPRRLPKLQRRPPSTRLSRTTWPSTMRTTERCRHRARAVFNNLSAVYRTEWPPTEGRCKTGTAQVEICAETTRKVDAAVPLADTRMATARSHSKVLDSARKPAEIFSWVAANAEPPVDSFTKKVAVAAVLVRATDHSGGTPPIVSCSRF